MTDTPIPADGWEFVTETFPDVVVRYAGGVAPFQSEGQVGELNFLLRENGGYAKLYLFDLGHTYDTAPFIPYASAHEGNLDVGRDNFLEAFEILYNSVENKAPLWAVDSFEDVLYNPVTYVTAWTEEEAIKNAEEKLLRDREVPLEKWMERFSAFGEENARLIAETRVAAYEKLAGVPLKEAYLAEEEDIETLRAYPDFSERKIALRKEK